MGDPKRAGSAVRAWVLAGGLALAVALGGCSASEIVQNWATPPAVTDLSQPNYRRIIADNIQAMFPDKTLLEDMEISGVRQVDHLTGPAWIVCLKLDAHNKPQQYAIFIKGDKVIDQRVGIVIDHCHKETYTRFDLPAPPKPGTKKPGADEAGGSHK